MQTQPQVNGNRRPVYYVSSTYAATLETVTPAPGTADTQYLYILIVFPHRPVESGAPRLFVCAEMIQGRNEPVLSVFDDTGYRVLENEQGDWSAVTMFTRRALEIAGERLGANFVLFEHSKWH